MAKVGDIDERQVQAPGFEDPAATVVLTVSKSWIMQNAIHGRRHRLMEFWGLIASERPPVNNIGYHEGGMQPELPGLMAAHALFQGIERPVADSREGEDIYVYLSRPERLYKFVAHMVCVAKLHPAPSNALFACYVRRYQEATDSGTSGMVLAWEWVRPDPSDPQLPDHSGTRYGKIMWRK